MQNRGETVKLDVGVATLSDFQEERPDGTVHTLEERTQQIISLGVLAEAVGLDHIGIGEHHTADFAVSSPGVVLSAIAAQTVRLRLTTAVTVLGVHDPVRLYQDFATLDLVSRGRAELTVGRSAFTEPFRLFGERLESYDALFAEKLTLLLKIRDEAVVRWHGQFRAPIPGMPIVPRAKQAQLPVWIGVGGSPESAERAGRLGLPMTLGYLGGTADSLRRLADLYRAAGARAGHAERLRLGVGLHYFGAASAAEARAIYPYYHDFLRPKGKSRSGYVVTQEQFDYGLRRKQALMIGTTDQITEKLIDLHRAVRFDRLQALMDWGGLPEDMVRASVQRLGEQIAPALREGVTSVAA